MTRVVHMSVDTRAVPVNRRWPVGTGSAPWVPTRVPLVTTQPEGVPGGCQTSYLPSSTRTLRPLTLGTSPPHPTHDDRAPGEICTWVRSTS